MARKILDVSDGLHRRKAQALCLLRRQEYEWHVIGVSIRRVLKGSTPLPRPRFIGKLPPAEIGGCHFQEPQGVNWQRHHRAEVNVPRLVRIKGNY